MSMREAVMARLSASGTRLADGLARIVKRASEYSVARGDTLSGIASRNGTDWKTLARINGIRDPKRLAVGQRLRLPVPRTSVPAIPVSSASRRMNDISERLHAKLNNPNLEAALLANFNRETGGSFDYATKEVGGRGYGIPQYTGPSLKAYKAWLSSTGNTDSARSQIDYFVDEYMPSRAGYRAHMAPGAKYTREQYADWLHRRVFTPAHTIVGNKAYSTDKIMRLTKAHNDFMNGKIRSVNGVWRGV